MTRFSAKSIVSAALFLFATFVVPMMGLSTAHAERGVVTSILYICGIKFKAVGNSVYLGLGYTSLEGRGQLSCYDILTGVTQKIPLRVTVRGPGAGLGLTGVIISGGVAGIGISRGPESLLGSYGAVRGSASAVLGAGGMTSLKISKEAVVLDVSLQAAKGLGAGVDLLSVKFERDIRSKAEIEKLAKKATPFVTEPEVVAPAAENVDKNTGVAAEVIYVREDQPVQILDAQGRVAKIIYLKKAQ